MIKLLIARLRQAWPDVALVVRGDSGFCRQRLIRWCERRSVGYVLGVARNARLEAIGSMSELALGEQYAASGMKQREIGEFSYAADSWDRERRVITRLEYGSQGNNPRFVVTNVKAKPRDSTINCTASAARPRTASRRRSWTCSARARAATSFSPTSFACCSPPWPTR